MERAQGRRANGAMDVIGIPRDPQDLERWRQRQRLHRPIVSRAAAVGRRHPHATAAGDVLQLATLRALRHWSLRKKILFGLDGP